MSETAGEQAVVLRVTLEASGEVTKAPQPAVDEQETGVEEE